MLSEKFMTIYLAYFELYTYFSMRYIFEGSVKLLLGQTEVFSFHLVVFLILQRFPLQHDPCQLSVSARGNF